MTDPATARTPITERLAAMEVQVAALTTHEEREAMSGWSRVTNNLTNEGKAQLIAILREARKLLRPDVAITADEPTAGIPSRVSAYTGTPQVPVSDERTEV